MKLRAELPPDREAEGRLTVYDDRGAVIFGPVRCRGEADNTNAAKRDNVIEDPTCVGGDHPYGVCIVGPLIWRPNPASSYGPCFITLRPVSGQALEAWQRGRRGVGAHGGDLGAGGILRSTYGCLRLDNENAEKVGKYLDAEAEAGRDVFYHCEPLVP